MNAVRPIIHHAGTVQAAVGDCATRCQMHVPSWVPWPWPFAWLSILTSLWGRDEVVRHPGGAGRREVQGGETLRASAVFSAQRWSPLGRTAGPGGGTPHTAVLWPETHCGPLGVSIWSHGLSDTGYVCGKGPLGGMACGGLSSLSGPGACGQCLGARLPALGRLSCC